ncbi:MAG: hypothetical protein JXB13_21550 [Phycisphaerae bacterium]|nr:hypothetical protein [Phycisphaerae bacterium]
MKTPRAIAVLLVCTCGSIASANVYDGFEDGDYTNNPTWTVVPIPDVTGAAEVVADPVRPGNLVLAGYGQESRHYGLTTWVAMPWTSFDMSMDILTLANDFNPKIVVRRNPPEPSNPDYIVDVQVRREPTASFSQLRIVEYAEDHPAHLDHRVDFDADPMGDWWRVHAWYDDTDNQIKVEIRRVVDDSLVLSHSLTPAADLSLEPPIEALDVGFEKTSWSYMDNVTLVPEPSSIVFVGLGCAAIRKRRP